MDAIAVAFNVAVLAVLLVAVIRRVVVANVRTARHCGMVLDERRSAPSGRLLLLSNVAFGLFAVALALYLLVAAWPGTDARTTHGARLMIAWTQGGHVGDRRVVGWPRGCGPAGEAYGSAVGSRAGGAAGIAKPRGA